MTEDHIKVQRVLNFSNPDACTGDYRVYDATGKLLGEAKDVPMAKITVPVMKIGLSVANVAGTSVLLDNLKLYVSGVGADLEIYDAKTGMLQIDSDQARDRNTAYRFSWMNATASEKRYSIVAEYYNGTALAETKVIEQIRMVPGSDGVNTRIVEVGEGQSVKLYARDDSHLVVPEDTAPNTNTTKPGGISGGDIAMLVVIGICALGIGALAVVAVMLLTKKPTAKKAPQKDTAE